MMNGFHVASSCPLTRETLKKIEGAKDEYEMWDTHFGPFRHNFCGCIYPPRTWWQQWICSLNQHHQSCSLLPASELWKRRSTHRNTDWYPHTHTQLRRGVTLAWPPCWPPICSPTSHHERLRHTGTELKDAHVHSLASSAVCWSDGYLLRQCSMWSCMCLSVCSLCPLLLVLIDSWCALLIGVRTPRGGPSLHQWLPSPLE